MKEFERCMDKWICEIPNPKCSNMHCDDCKIILQEGWKQALKWALKELEYQYKTSAPGDAEWQGNFIEEELNNHD
jgi:hypothetical protein